jgi:hypothetical protein
MARTFMTARKSMPASRPIAPKKMKAIAKRFRNSHSKLSIKLKAIIYISYQ